MSILEGEKGKMMLSEEEYRTFMRFGKWEI
jgi:hypothetical protein